MDYVREQFGVSLFCGFSSCRRNDCYNLLAPAANEDVCAYHAWNYWFQVMDDMAGWLRDEFVGGRLEGYFWSDTGVDVMDYINFYWASLRRREAELQFRLTVATVAAGHILGLSHRELGIPAGPRFTLLRSLMPLLIHTYRLQYSLELYCSETTCFNWVLWDLGDSKCLHCRWDDAFPFNLAVARWWARVFSTDGADVHQESIERGEGPRMQEIWRAVTEHYPMALTTAGDPRFVYELADLMTALSLGVELEEIGSETTPGMRALIPLVNVALNYSGVCRSIFNGNN